jgi:hypothetical protein
VSHRPGQASVLDMSSRRIMGFALSEHHDAELAYGSAGHSGRRTRWPGTRVIMHTDGAASTPQACSALPVGVCRSVNRWAGPGQP